jgi:two-component system sensor histidine kinase/response regulator
MDTLRILIVDDEPGIRTAIARALRHYRITLPEFHADFAVTLDQAATGEEALEKIAADPPDLMLLDHKLPGMSGVDVLERLAEQKAQVLTLMITAYASLETAVNATRRGAYNFLAKPFTPDELKAAIFEAVKHLAVQRQARRLADERRRVRFEFLSVVAHELKAPTSAIEGYLQMLQDRTLGNDLSAYGMVLDRALFRLDSMRKLLADLLDLTRIESGQKRRELQEVDVQDVARGAVELAAEQGAPRGITVALTAGEPVSMQADRGEVELILANLLSNALKYNRDGGRIDVTVRRLADKVELRVADTGIGLSEEDKARLFGEFVRVKNEQTRHIEGSGLGLSIVRKLANLYGGEAGVQSELGVGSCFWVRV